MAFNVVAVLNNILADEKYKLFLSVVKGLRNGLVYGAKVRFSHAFVTSFLFKSASFQEHIRSILKATFTHSRNLGLFVALYKFLKILIRNYICSTYGLNVFAAAFLGGFYIFGTDNKINEQINLYLLSRVIYGLIKLLSKKGYIPELRKEHSSRIFGALVWGLAIWLFEMNQNERKVLQPSLQTSMTYLYHDSDHWSNIYDFLFKSKS